MATASYIILSKSFLEFFYSFFIFSFFIRGYSNSKFPVMYKKKNVKGRLFTNVLPIHLFPFFSLIFFNLTILVSSPIHYKIIVFLLCLSLLVLCIPNINSFGTTLSLFKHTIALFVPLFAFYIFDITSFLHFLFIIEIMGYIFYFQFFLQKSSKYFWKFLDLFLLYYWGSFVGTILLFWTGYALLTNYNTLDFQELSILILNYDISTNTSVILLLGLLIKLGASGVHFLKIEMYKHLSIEALVNFSIFSVFIFLLIVWQFSTLGLINSMGQRILVALVLLGLCFFTITIKYIDNLVTFFGYSGLITISLSLLLIVNFFCR